MAAIRRRRLGRGAANKRVWPGYLHCHDILARNALRCQWRDWKMDLKVIGATALRQSCLPTPGLPVLLSSSRLEFSVDNLTREETVEPRPVRDGRERKFRVPCPGV